MSDDGYVPVKWEFFDENEVVTDRFYLRADHSLPGLCDYERYSLFRSYPREQYGRIEVFAMPLGVALKYASEAIKAELYGPVP